MTKKFRQLRQSDLIDHAKIIPAFRDVRSIAGLPQMTYVFGPRGNGKSMSIQWLLYQCGTGAKAVPMFYMTLNEMIIELYAGDFKEKDRLLKRVTMDYGLIAIDEIDKVKLTDWKEDMIFYILDKLMANMKKVVLAGNTDIAKLKDQLGVNIVSRILAEATIINWQGEVLR